MFNDDILCPLDLYPKARELLLSHSFIINEEKTGKIWNTVPYFAGVTLGVRGISRFHEAQSDKGAIFCARYHWQRKAAMLTCSFQRRWIQNYHYERIFGYEVTKGEAFKHPTMLGIDPTATYHDGWVRGGELRKVQHPEPEPDEMLRRVWNIAFPWKNATKKKDFHRTRMSYRNKKDIVSYTCYDDYCNPRIRERNNEPIIADFKFGSYQLPKWADLQQLMFTGKTCGRTTEGTYPKKAAHEMLSFLHSRDPIHSWINGGYDIISYFYREPALDNWTLQLYTMLKRSSLYQTKSAIKLEVPGQSKIVPHVDHTSFLNEILEKEDLEQEFIIDSPLEPIEAVEWAGDHDIDTYDLDDDNAFLPADNADEDFLIYDDEENVEVASDVDGNWD
jgi:hypothetical protein